MDRPPASLLPQARQLDDQLGRRCALFVWAALVAAVAAGLLAWGPVRAAPRGAPAAPMALWLAAGVQLLAASIGVAALAAAPWSNAMRRALRGSLGAMAVAAVLMTALGRSSNVVLQLAAHGALVLASSWLACGLLADRLHEAWGSALTCALVAFGVLVATAVSCLSAAGGGAPDLRALWLAAALPVLLLPANMLSLPARDGSSGDAQLLLGLHGVGLVLQLGDAVVPHAASAALSGGTASAWCLAAAAGWLAYRAGRGSAPESVACAGAEEAFTHASTSANT